MTGREHATIDRQRRDALVAQQDFKLAMGTESFWKRVEEINALPHVEFKGRDLRTIRCNQCGRERNEPLGVLWCLVSLKVYRCSWCMMRG